MLTGPYDPRIPPAQIIVPIYNKNPGKKILGRKILSDRNITFTIIISIIRPTEIKKIKKNNFVKKVFLI